MNNTKRSSKMARSTTRSTITLSTVGDVKREVKRDVKKSRWAALAESSDTDTETALPLPLPVSVPEDLAAALLAFIEKDPILSALDRCEIQWGDLFREKITLYPAAPRPPFNDLLSNPHAPLRATEEEIWDQPFALNLKEYWPETYDTREMTDADYNSMMEWIHSMGWYVSEYDRDGVRVWTDNAAPLYWNPSTMEADEEAAPAPVHRCSHSHSHPKKEKAAVVIPRFCREGATCTAASCRYVHGNTIPRLNEPCAFGEGCGASDPTGVKRSQCIRMHPGEEWTSELVITRTGY